MTSHLRSGWVKPPRQRGHTQVSFNCRHISAVKHIKSLVSNGRLGDVLQFRGWRGWRGSKATGGSGGIGSHILDIAEYLVGPIARVGAQTRALMRRGRPRKWAGTAEMREDERLDNSGVWIAEFESGAAGPVDFD